MNTEDSLERVEQLLAESEVGESLDLGNDSDPHSLVRAPLKPRSPTGSESIALPEPDAFEEP
jgi:hypothetical protein